jgi:hypothetical protein
MHGGCTIKVTAIDWGAPTFCLETLSIAVMVTVPEYVPAARPARETPIFVDEGADKLTIPLAGDAVSQVPPVVVLVLAVQSKAFAQVPLAEMFAVCAAGAS